ncbi:asparagine synthase (glutamine-hydrolyzing) [Amycolatopsis minnesotensis]|uniref:asparagine synthase (glutamine-hydrolyzing) n=1 Tax=Amycolatopsis minnesotensis TaxID=337894 RepID=A0ABP5BBZ1_9PSEU
MCGIVGWVDFERDLTAETGAVRRMTDTMAYRGPDDEGVWVRRQIALGHRRLAVIDIAGGRQPMWTPERSPDGDPLAVLTYSGEVYNFAELREELKTLGHRFETRSDTEVVLRAYLQWGTGCAARFNGMFAFALWDTRSEELVLVRDRLGVKPLYYYPTAHGALFGSEAKAVLANPLATAEMDLDGLRDTLATARVPGRTPLRNLFEVKPGHIVRVSRGGIREHRYWALETRPHTDGVEDTVANVRALLEDIVARQMVADVPLCTLLSGGLDSSALTALAQRGLTAAGAGRVRTYSVDFAGQTDNFRPEEFREAPDSPFAAELVAHAGTDHREILLDTTKLVDPGVRDAVRRAWDLPYGIGDHDPSLYLLFQAVREASTVALSGEAADEVFGGYLWFHEPKAVEASTFPWHAMSPAPVELVATAFLDRDLTAALDLGTYIADTYADAVHQVEHLPGEDLLERRMRTSSHLHITRWLQMMLDRKDRMSMASGLEVRVPFCDHRLVDYVYNAPWSMKTFDGKEKSLLRAATADLLPRSIAERRKAPYPSTQDIGYDTAINSELGKIVAEPGSPAFGLLDLDAVDAHLAKPITRAYSMIERSAFTEPVVRLNAALALHDVRLVGMPA